jgi:hypothetical protein
MPSLRSVCVEPGERTNESPAARVTSSPAETVPDVSPAAGVPAGARLTTSGADEVTDNVPDSTATRRSDASSSGMT